MASTKQTTSFKDLINSEEPVLIDFYADWCGPCKAFAPILDELKQEMANEVRVVKIDVDANQAIAQKLGVRSIPTVMIFQKGELKWRAQGLQSLSTLQQQLGPLVA